MKNTVIIPSFFEKTMATGGTCLAMMEKTALCHALVGIFCS